MPAALTWDNTGEHFYEAGVKKGVVFPMSNGTYQKGAAWNGLTAVKENPSGAETTAKYADDIKYLNMVSNEEYGATIEAFTYPDEFAECDGSVEVATGVTINQQPRKPFGFSYVTGIGNDTDGFEKGYKIHLVYNALAKPSSKDYGTVNETPDAMTFSWEVSTTPTPVPGHKPTAHITIDSRKVSSEKLTAFETILYGSTTEDSRLPLPAEVIALMSGSQTTTTDDTEGE